MRISRTVFPPQGRSKRLFLWLFVSLLLATVIIEVYASDQHHHQRKAALAQRY